MLFTVWSSSVIREFSFSGVIEPFSVSTAVEAFLMMSSAFSNRCWSFGSLKVLLAAPRSETVSSEIFLKSMDAMFARISVMLKRRLDIREGVEGT